MSLDRKTRRHQEMRRLFEAAVRSGDEARFYDDLRQEFYDERHALGDRYSIRHLFEQFVPDGREAIQFMRPSNAGGYVSLQESAGAVDTAKFANIIGQMQYTSTLKGFESPELVGDRLVETIQTDFNGERIPGIGRVGDDVEVVKEGDPYPNATFGEEFIDTPETIKRGLIIDITKEAIFFDRTGLLVSEAAKVGLRIGVNKEKRILDAVCGISTIYRRNGAAAEATYQANNSVSNTLADWTSFDTALQKLHEIVDPITGEPVAITPNAVLVPKRLENTARRVLNATMVRKGTDSGANQTYTNGNQIDQQYDVITGPYVKARTGSDSTWFLGDFRAGFVYMQNWPLQVIQEGESSEVGFTRDIVLRYKATERGAAAVRERLVAVKNT